MIRIAIVGCGRILNAHLQGFKALREAGVDSFRITALVSRRESDALMFRRRGEGPTPRPPVVPRTSGDRVMLTPHTYVSDFQDDVDVEIYTDYREMLRQAPVDVVSDYTTHSQHHQVGLAALQAGKHLHTQKPLAITVRAAHVLVETAKAQGLTFGVFEMARNSEHTRAMRWAMDRGFVGRPQWALISSIEDIWAPDKVICDTPWRHGKLDGGAGRSLDAGVHLFDWLRYTLGEVAWVSGVTRILEPIRYRRDEAGKTIAAVPCEVDDTYMATIGFENGAVVQAVSTAAGRGESLRIRETPAFYGTKGCIKEGEIIRDDGHREPLLPLFKASMGPEERDSLFPLGVEDPFALQQLDFLRAIEEGRSPETSGEEGLRDLACAYAISESSTLGRQVTLEEMLSGEVDAYQSELDKHYGLLGAV